MQFSDVLSSLMRDKGITAYRVAKDLGYSKQTIANWLAGRTKPEGAKIEEVAAYFHVSIDYLMKGETSVSKYIAEYLDMLMERDGINAYKLYKYTGIPQQSISNWRKGRTKPNAQSVAKLASYFNVPLDSFIEKGDDSIEHDNKPVPVTEDELNKKLISLIRQLSTEEIQRVCDFVLGILSSR